MLILMLAACGLFEADPPPPPPPEAPPAPEVDRGRYPNDVVVDGVTVAADWDDGDTFSAPNPEGGKDIGHRLKGFNTLESYAPVHRWGDWTAQELYDVAKQAGARARSQTWTCHDTGEGGGYGRKLVDCPELRRTMLSEGLAHVFAVDEQPDPADLAAQADAVANKRGMWAKGAPEGLVTSLHSLDEKEGQADTYNRVLSVTTGKSHEARHSDSYAPCQEVCLEGSCMVYMPFSKRYGKDRLRCEDGGASGH